jgi:hypothetical protein
MFILQFFFLNSLTIFLTIIACLYFFSISNESICALLFFSLHTPSVIGIASTAQIAGLRYFSLVRTVKHKPVDDNRLAVVNVCTIVTLFG